MLMVVAAGNAGQHNRARTLGSPAVAKNVLAVGASQSYGDGTPSSGGKRGIDFLANFSSRGPTPDGRIAPHVVGPREGSASAFLSECGSGSSEGVAYESGTSAATAAISGAAALVRQYFKDGFHLTGERNAASSHDPTASLVKAVMINGAREVLGVDNGAYVTPSYYYDGAQGFGRVSLAHSLPLRGHNWINALVVDRTDLRDGEMLTYEFVVNKDNACPETEVRATLVWADPPASAGCVRCLVNDLDLVVLNGRTGRMDYPNGLGGKDDTNNVERVIALAANGDTFTVTVHAANLDRERQAFSLIITGCITFENDIAFFGGEEEA